METNDFERLESLLKSKNYEQLSGEEKEWIEKEIGGEQAYLNLQSFVTRLSGDKISAPSQKIKKNLMTAFRSRNQTVWSRVVSYRMPAFANIFVWAVLAVGVWYWIPERRVMVEKQVPIEKTLLDTVYVELPKDTVIIEKTIQVEVPVYIEKKEEPEIIVVKGSSLSDQKDLQRLLVSGEEI